MKKLSLFLIINLLFTSCASMFSGTSERINLRSDVAGTKFYLNDVEVGTDSASITVAKKKLKQTTFVGRKAGCRDVSVDVQTKFDATSLWGLLLDLGIISILVIDLGITGAVNEAERTSYVLNPSCSKV